jgi:hypothetical protein
MVQQTLPGRIHRSGNVFLPHLGEGLDAEKGILSAGSEVVGVLKING